MVSQLVLYIFVVTTLSNSVKIKSKCSENDVHCVDKKEEMHWCTDQGCSTCTDHNCVISCKGFACGMCPNGDCCNGINCNVCYNNTCCSTSSCNYCIYTCKDACKNITECESTCISQCQNSEHDVFVVPLATHDRKVTVYIKGLPYKGNVTSGKFPTHSKTAIVSIDGINQTATILFLWTKICKGDNCSISDCAEDQDNHCNCMQDCELECQKDCYEYDSCYSKCEKLKQYKEFNYLNTLTPGCCHIVHPQICYNSYIYTFPICYKRSHRECSKMCSSKFIHITSYNGGYPLKYNRCYYIQAYPYLYCGNYVIRNCDSCYVCNGKYNPNYCVKTSACSSQCRKTFLPFQSTIQRPTQLRNSSPLYAQPIRYPYYTGYPQTPTSQLLGVPLQYG